MLFQKLLANSSVYIPQETITFTGAYSGRNTYSYSVSLGSEYPKRRILVVASSYSASISVNGGLISTLTINGSSASFISGTRRFSYVVNGQFYNVWNAAAFIMEVPSGTSATIALTLNQYGSANDVVIHVYSLDSAKTGFDVSADTTTPFNYTRTFGAGEIYLGFGLQAAGSGSVVWTNATVRNTRSQTSITLSSASYYPSAAGSRTITFAPTVTTSSSLTNIVFV